jgi:hypothetical protein
MKLLARLRSWLRWMVNRKRLESEMETEVRFHMESYTADLVRKGVPPGCDATSAHRVGGRVPQRCNACIIRLALVG